MVAISTDVNAMRGTDAWTVDDAAKNGKHAKPGRRTGSQVQLSEPEYTYRYLVGGI